jgi:hypothetical protein
VQRGAGKTGNLANSLLKFRRRRHLGLLAEILDGDQW